jgi:hypothetical protein
LQYEELMPESEDLGTQDGSILETLPNRVEQREDDREHGRANYSCRRSNSTGSMRTEFLAGTA